MKALLQDAPKTRMTIRILVLLVIYSVFGCRTVKEKDLFFPRTMTRPSPAEGRLDLELALPDGDTIGGWWVQHPGAERMLFYFYGNGETAVDSLFRMNWLAQTLDTDVICVDYRGYGFSSGAPRVDALLSDALAVYDYCTAHELARGKEIFVYGRSIGTIPALQMADERALHGLVLEAPFSTAGDVIRAWRNNLGPLKYIIHLRPEASLAKRRQPIDFIGEYTGPLLIFHGARDDVIPQELGRAMFEAAASGEKTWVDVREFGHNDLSLNTPEVEAALRTFFGRPPH